VNRQLLQYRPFKKIEPGLVQDSGNLRTTDYISQRMGRVRQSGTTPELRVRQACSNLGMRYRTRNRDLPGSPDLANRSRRWAIFVHGCYWHRHPGCPRTTTPKTNRDFWLAKFARNCQRDCEAHAALEEAGFAVLVVWECETESADSLRETLRLFSNHAGYRSQ
jgi:DNA mismatch endonuclease (patch repair protein)